MLFLGVPVNSFGMLLLDEINQQLKSGMQQDFILVMPSLFQRVNFQRRHLCFAHLNGRSQEMSSASSPNNGERKRESRRSNRPGLHPVSRFSRQLFADLRFGRLPIDETRFPLGQPLTTLIKDVLVPGR